MKKLDELQARIDKLESVLLFCANSFDDNVRINVAKAGLAMDKLINDPNPFVRRAIVDNRYELERFLYDEDAMVREGVAKQGYGLDLLVHDKELKVRKAVARNKKLSRALINELIKDESPEIRLEMAKRGEKPTRFSKDLSAMVRAEVANQGNMLKELVNDPSAIVRTAVASQGYGLRKLTKDPDERVARAAKLYGFQHEDAVGEWKVGRAMRSCSICGHRMSKTKVALQRCPQCNFVMKNFAELPAYKPKSRKKNPK